MRIRDEESGESDRPATLLWDFLVISQFENIDFIFGSWLLGKSCVVCEREDFVGLLCAGSSEQGGGGGGGLSGTATSHRTHTSSWHRTKVINMAEIRAMRLDHESEIAAKNDSCMRRDQVTVQKSAWHRCWLRLVPKRSACRR